MSRTSAVEMSIQAVSAATIFSTSGSVKSHESRVTSQGSGVRNRGPGGSVSPDPESRLATSSRVVIKKELVRVRPQVDRRDILGPFQRDPGVDHVGSEHVALQQEVVIGFESGDGFGQRAGDRLDALLPLVVQLVQV